MSEPLYHSSFEYVTQSLELNQTNEVNNITTENDESPATNKNLMNFFANRNQNEFLIPILHEISSFHQFVK